MFELFTDIFSTIWSVWKSIWEGVSEVAPIVIKFVLWVLCGIFILPCVFVAGNLYEPWVKWGESM
ncbi:MAG: hypothetical protein KGI59_02905 [Patescibacteria group bacterium]|nr:hypothetical protein [Patescibacteria group bacterium]